MMHYNDGPMPLASQECACFLKEIEWRFELGLWQAVAVVTTTSSVWKKNEKKKHALQAALKTGSDTTPNQKITMYNLAKF